MLLFKNRLEMKSIKKIALAYICAISFGSCTNILDIEPTNTMIPKTVDDFETLLLSGYPAKNYFINTELRTDNVYANSRSRTGVKDQYVPWFIWADSHQYGEEEYDDYWNVLYSSIYYANTIIDKYKGNYTGTKDDELCEYINGEAYAIRAWAYFYLANLYAEPYSKESLNMPCVPLILTSEKNLEYTDNNTRASIETIWKQILDDLNQASKLLDSKQGKGKYRFNYTVIEAFKSRVFLYMNRYNDAITSADKALTVFGFWDMNGLPDLIEEGKPPLGYFNLERGLLETGYKEEVIFFTGGRANKAHPFNGTIRPDTTFLKEFTRFDEKIIEEVKDKDGKPVIDKKTGKPKTNEGRNPIIDYRRYIFETQDLRGEGIDPSSGKTTYFMYANQTPDHTYFIGLKSGEILLNRAEAYARLGKKDKALSDLEYLWKNRFKKEDYEIIKNEILKEENIVKVVMSERRKETAFDAGLRWFDLRRTTKPKLEHHLPNFEGDEKTDYILEKGDLKYVLQIPISEQRRSPNMKLNPR